MRMMSLLLVLGLAAVPCVASAQPVPRILQCEDCTPQRMEEMAIALGQTAGGSFHVFSLRRQVLSRYWVDYDHDAGQWIATPVATHDGMAEVFGHMLDAHARRPTAFSGEQVFRAGTDAIGGGAHDPVQVAVQGEHDSAYGRFVNAVRQCFDSESCTADVDPALAPMLVAEKKAVENGFSLFRDSQRAIAWEGTQPRLEALFCSTNDDCAIVEYGDPGWAYTGTLADGGQGKRYPVYGDTRYYAFNDPAAAARFERGLRSAGARVEGTWQADSVLFCETAYATASCSYRMPPFR